MAAELAANNPERVDKLVLIAPIGLWIDEHPVPDISGIPPDQLPGLILADPTGPLAAMLPAPDPTNPESLLAAVNNITSILQFIWPLPDKGLDRRLYRVQAPTLLVWGAQDKLVHPAYGRAFAAAIKGARLEMVEHAAHLPQLEQPEQVASAVGAFLG